MNLTKKEFIEKCKSLGHKNYEDVLSDMGFGKSCLKRYRLNDKIKDRLCDLFEGWKVEKGYEEPRPEPKPKPEPVPGFEISNKDYHASNNLSASKLKMVIENAAKFHYLYVLKNPKPITEALLIGSMHHTLVLEPEEFDKSYIACFAGGRSKADIVDAIEMLGQTVSGEENIGELRSELEALQQADSRQFVSLKQIEIAKKTASKALKSWYVIEAGEKEILRCQLQDVIKLETSYVDRVFYGEIEGLEFQVRPDLLVNLGKKQPIWFCIDLKTAPDATLGTFSRQASSFYYDIQQWVYCEILRQNGINLEDFRFCVVGKEEASQAAYYKLDREDIEDAKEIVLNGIKKYKYCQENNIWQEQRFKQDTVNFEPVSTVKLPMWRKYQMIDQGITI